MSTEAQLAANRQNALQSTGPKTPEGKAASSQNALKNGIDARAVLLPDDNHDEFREFTAEMFEHLRPKGPVENQIAERIVATSWRLRRTVGIEKYMFMRFGHHFPKDAPPNYFGEGYAMINDGESGGRNFERVTRYEAHLHRLLRRDLQDLLALQSFRRPENEPKKLQK
jgi:hypothetical protein